jgi:acetyltransferase-like isoleucine patch superfamily enzyme
MMFKQLIRKAKRLLFARRYSTHYPDYFLHSLGHPTVYYDTKNRLHLGKNVVLNNAFLDLHDDIWIGDFTFFGHGVSVLTGTHDVSSYGLERQRGIQSAPVRIDVGVWIASFSIVLPGTEIGAHSVVSAGSVVRGLIPPCVIVAGNPAQIVKRLKGPDGFAT